MIGNRVRGFSILALCGVMLLLLLNAASATALDLITHGADGYLNGGYFVQIDPDHATGTGVLNPFVRIQANTLEEGYNTDGALELDEKAGIWTHSLLLTDIPVFTIGGVRYRQFVLDINENTGGQEQYISLDKIQIFLGSAGNLTGYPSNLGTKVWDLDLGADGDSWIKLDYALESGSGSGDMYAYIPDSVFQGQNNQYVYLYSQFGGEWNGLPGNKSNGLDTSDGFEEWAVQKTATPIVPEPGSLFALALGIIPLGARLKKRF